MDTLTHIHHKRPLKDLLEFEQPCSKRRLLDNLNNLTIGLNNRKYNSNSTGLFGNFSKDQLNKPLNDPNTVIINNIDNFLNEEVSHTDYSINNLFLSCGLNLNNSAFQKIKNNLKDKRVTDDLLYNLIWKEYLASYFSIIKYYEPLKVVYKMYLKWLNNRSNKTYKSPSIEEIDEKNSDLIDMELDDDCSTTFTAPNFNDSDYDLEDDDESYREELQNLAKREEKLRSGMSDYGSYYSLESLSHNLRNSCDQNYHPHQMIDTDEITENDLIIDEDMDDDISMIIDDY